jgi:hypothetical protein
VNCGLTRSAFAAIYLSADYPPIGGRQLIGGTTNDGRGSAKLGNRVRSVTERERTPEFSAASLGLARVRAARFTEEISEIFSPGQNLLFSPWIGLADYL